MSKRPLIICSDPGLDDALAFLWIFSRDEFDIRGIIPVNGNTGLENALNNTLSICSFLGRTEIPVIRGAAKPLLRSVRNSAAVHGSNGLGKSVLPKPVMQALPISAAQFIFEQAAAHPGELEILSLGPLTDIAAAFIAYPQLPQLLKSITFMGGGIYRSNVTPAAEFNVYADPEAAAVVLDSGVSLNMIGLDATHQHIFSQEKLPSITRNTPVSKFAVDVMQDYIDSYKRFGIQEGAVLHDPLAAIYLVYPEAFKMEFYNVVVETEGELTLGKTVADVHRMFDRKPNVNVAMGLDPVMVEKIFVEGLNKLFDKE